MTNDNTKALERPVEPSDPERAEWSDVTREYVEYLEGVENHALLAERDEWKARADLAAPKVKPLVWVDLHGDGSLYETDVDNPLGYHAVINRRGQLGWWYFGFYETLEAAKAAAQADYERRILEALE